VSEGDTVPVCRVTHIKSMVMSYTSKDPDCDYDKWEISEVICATAIM